MAYAYAYANSLSEKNPAKRKFLRNIGVVFLIGAIILGIVSGFAELTGAIYG